MNPIEAVFSFLYNYGNFSRRASRSEFLWSMAFLTLMYILLALLTVANAIVGIVYFSTFQIAMLIPILALSVRRLHDTNRTGWWFFLYWVPFFGVIILFIFSVIPSTIGSNHYGPSPKMLKGSA